MVKCRCPGFTGSLESAFHSYPIGWVIESGFGSVDIDYFSDEAGWTTGGYAV